MHDRIKTRLSELRRNFEAGQAQLGKLEAEATQLRETLLRIAGAIQVLEETLAAEDGASGAFPTRTAAE